MVKLYHPEGVGGGGGDPNFVFYLDKIKTSCLRKVSFQGCLETPLFGKVVVIVVFVAVVTVENKVS